MTQPSAHTRTLDALQTQRRRITQLETHPYVQRVNDVSFNGDRELLEVSFHHAVPRMFTNMDDVTVLECWLDTLPGLWGAIIGDERARKLGLGSTCITVLVEVEPRG